MMDLFYDIFGTMRRSGFLIAILLVLFYFAYSGIKGDRGWLTYIRLQHEIAAAQKIADSYAGEKNKLESRVALLSDKSLDVDMLDERARTVLSLAKTNEFVILDPAEEDTSSTNR